MTDPSKEIDDASQRLAIDISETKTPLNITIRSIALSIAQRHCGDTTVTEGNLYQQLKMDGLLAGPLTVNHVVEAALIFERYLWGEWSKDIVGQAIDQVLNEAEAVLSKREFNSPEPDDNPIKE